MRWAHALRARLRLLSRKAAEERMDEEISFHLEMEAEKHIREGMSREEARRRAVLAFGGVEARKEVLRAGRPFAWTGGLTLDLKLGVRMLRKYPGLSMVSVFGMAIAVAIGAGGFGFIQALLDDALPLNEGEQVVALQHPDIRNPGRTDWPIAADFLHWREELSSVRNLSAFVSEDGILSVPGASTAPVRLARMTASGFQVAEVPPILGRPLLEDDELHGAPPVVVIAYEEWQSRFGGNREIVGQAVRIDTIVHTVVGVMPEGFRFPINHRYWIPLRLPSAQAAGGGGPALQVFGRLADGTTLEQAQAELTVVGQQSAVVRPETHEFMRPRVLPYTRAFSDLDDAASWLLRIVQFGLALLLVLVSVNVAILVYARTAARTGEIAVRTALGASRQRVIVQLFAEAFILSLIAALIGLAIAGAALEWIWRVLADTSTTGLPFWFRLSLSPTLVAYILALCVLSAVIVGVIPALKATATRVQGRLQELSSGGGGMRLGRTWTALVVVQVATTVAVLPGSFYVAGWSVQRSLEEPAYQVEQFVRANISRDRAGAYAVPDTTGHAQHFRRSISELLRRLEGEPALSGVTIASRFPGSEWRGRVEVEGSTGSSWVWTNEVGADLFSVFDVQLLAGRWFVESDAAPGANAIVVDSEFADGVLGGGDVLGRRVRYVLSEVNSSDEEVETGPWMEVVGVVPVFTAPPGLEAAAPKVYQPLAVDALPASVVLALRVRPSISAATFLQRLREVTASVDPTLQLREVQTATAVERERRQGLLLMALAIGAIAGSALALSAAGIHAMMSFIVARRRREIGLRAALGAHPIAILTGLFARAGTQLASGAAVGLLLAVEINREAGGGLLADELVIPLASATALVLTIGLVAVFGPARRALAVPPAEALREE